MLLRLILNVKINTEDLLVLNQKVNAAQYQLVLNELVNAAQYQLVLNEEC